MFNYFDLHCDTPYRMYKENQAFDRNELHVSLDKVAGIDHYAQLAAYCPSRRISDEEAFAEYLAVTERFNAELDRLSDRVSLCTGFTELELAEKSNKTAVFHMVEDARLVGEYPERLELLYAKGCRFLTLVWGGLSCIGGAHDTDEGFTDFGRSVANRCFDLGIVPDVSHSSERLVDELSEIALGRKKPFIASHSDSYEVYGHSRNLRDRHLDTIIKLGGLVGVSMCVSHLKDRSVGARAGIDDAVRHIEHYLERGAGDCLCFGCDFDGTDLPDGIESIADIHKIPDRLAQLNYPDELIGKICYTNARDFIWRNLK